MKSRVGEARKLVSLNRLQLVVAHELGELVVAFGSDPLDAGCAIGSEHHTDHLRDEIVEFFALFRIGKFGAIGTAFVTVFYIAGPDLTPGGF